MPSKPAPPANGQWPLLGAVRSRVAALLLAAALVCVASPALACPSCEAGRAARVEIFGAGFLRNLSIALLPFLIIGAVCLHVQNAGRPR